ncbi:LacI family DNA-binding transcriptional regulator [Aquimarina aquimarini]|uniref:LacI family DNA-binding transcriptional regulator n=1 Tax=Aquimarina aquimarini TaxID=1191734 RepID=UPI000D54FF12|nr:LacI family DNA-binding transcriptional regulator [Aquimarina aquimarini]
MKKRITLKDISRLSGFSISTISKALHDNSDISQKTKKKIREVARIYNYVPNFLAKSLKNNIPNVIEITIEECSIQAFLEEVENIPLLKNKTSCQTPKMYTELPSTKKMMGSDIAGIIVLLSDKGE